MKTTTEDDRPGILVAAFVGTVATIGFIAYVFIVTYSLGELVG